MEKIDEKGFRTYLLFVQGQKGVHRVSILENTKSVMTSCSCGGVQKCMHVLQVLSGASSSLLSESIEMQEKLVARLNNTEEGRKIIRKAGAYTNNVECPECQGKKVMRLNVLVSTYNQIFSIKKARYKCLDCGLTW